MDSQIIDEDENFATCRSLSSNQSGGQKRKLKKTANKKPKRKKCQFIDDEAGVSGDESEDDDEDDFISQSMLGCTQHDIGDPEVDMHAKYLQSIRSPLKMPAFKIPAPGYRANNPMMQIYSQPPGPEDISDFVEVSVSLLLTSNVHALY